MGWIVGSESVSAQRTRLLFTPASLGGYVESA